MLFHSTLLLAAREPGLFVAQVVVPALFCGVILYGDRDKEYEWH